jgi:carbon storage regulator CsrA
MLVLSRKPNEKILLPALDITVQVVSINKSSVRLGIEAPPQVAVIREELQSRQGNWPEIPPARPVAPAPDSRLAQLLGNRLRIAGTGLTQLRQLIESGNQDEVLDVLDRLEEDFDLLRRRLDSQAEQAPPRVTLVEARG